MQMASVERVVKEGIIFTNHYSTLALIEYSYTYT
jgi:hypothetical protein